jgi:hypothetical protein
MKNTYLLLALALISLPVFSFASNIGNTKITRVLVGPHYGKNVILTISVKATELPSCQTNKGYSYVFDGTTASGKMTLSVVLAAYAAQKDVWLAGTNTCSLYGGIENLKHIVAK